MLSNPFIRGLTALSLAVTVAAKGGQHRVKRVSDTNAGELHDFQVYPPVLTASANANGKNEYGCVVTQTLMDYDFANSYGSPYVGFYTPPDCDFNRVVIEFTLTSKGRQYDRLALMYFNSTEIWRTSTAEPTTDGIYYTYTKEMHQYLSLWKEPQKLIFDLGNIVNSEYTGILNTTLTATFFTVPDTPAAADKILPISRLLGASNESSVAVLPSEKTAVTYTLPRNLKRAVISVSACGQADEEFWYQNTFSSDVDTFEDVSGALYGDGPWREVQVLIDGMLAGVSWPFPVVFTGGIVPGFWRPIVGIDAFDLREHEIDITPFIPYLSDGKPHTFDLIVVSINDHGGDYATILNSTTDSWYVTGKIFLFEDEKDHITTGSMPVIKDPLPSLQITRSITTNSTGSNETLTETTTAKRSLLITSQLKTSSGEKEVSWSQDISYENFNQLTDYGWVQSTTQKTTGTDKTGSGIGYSLSYEYPFTCDWWYFETDEELGIFGNISRSLTFDVLGPAVFPNGVQASILDTAAEKSQSGLSKVEETFASASLGSSLRTSQSATASYFSDDSSTTNPSYSFGSLNQTMSFQGVGSDGSVEIYSRDVAVVNSTITHDQTLFEVGSSK
ncbi:hypothetical protein N7520_006356 [Penicillium odoratum]|uniref:uncharacterized protein n=1 Tax=Penicillium odoratum TaxID=1167516 RepID=UPI002546917D|nr:uncharacterized protein N7520_006356 [Penicillium odoratum]KAJ5759200.1 hypothetical protein N7520_006356 [Penicillium odoratum]